MRTAKPQAGQRLPKSLWSPRGPPDGKSPIAQPARDSMPGALLACHTLGDDVAMAFINTLYNLWPNGDVKVPGLRDGIAASAPTVFPKYGIATPLLVAHVMASSWRPLIRLLTVGTH